MKNIRQWAWETLTNSSSVTSLLSNGADSIYSAGSLTTKPEDRTFIVLSLGESLREPGVPARRVPVDVWAHDRSGGYTVVDDVLAAVTSALSDALPPADDGIRVVPQGESGELADDVFGTMARTATFSVVVQWPEGGPR